MESIAVRVEEEWAIVRDEARADDWVIQRDQWMEHGGETVELDVCAMDRWEHHCASRPLDWDALEERIFGRC